MEHTNLVQLWHLLVGGHEAEGAEDGHDDQVERLAKFAVILSNARKQKVSKQSNDQTIQMILPIAVEFVDQVDQMKPSIEGQLGAVTTRATSDLAQQMLGNGLAVFVEKTAGKDPALAISDRFLATRGLDHREQFVELIQIDAVIFAHSLQLILQRLVHSFGDSLVLFLFDQS